VKKKSSPICPLPKRLREARTEVGVSQKRLGILAGMDQFSASSRVNQYETGKHTPDYKTARRLADAIGIPVNYLYTDDDEMALMVLLLHRASRTSQNKIKKLLKSKP